jgi:hypothetical protein
MEFENPIEKYKKEFVQYATFEDIIAINNEITLTELSNFKHETDNRWLETSLGKTVHLMRQYGYNFVGYCAQAPWISTGRDCAVVFEDSATFEKYWCHINTSILNWWKEQAGIV